MADSLFNKQVFDQLKSASGGQSVNAVLLYFDTKGSTALPAWEFLVSPAKMKYNNKPEYGGISPLGSAVKEQQYNHTSGGSLELSDILMNVWCYGKSLRSLTDGLKTLIKANPKAIKKPKVIPISPPATKTNPTTTTPTTASTTPTAARIRQTLAGQRDTPAAATPAAAAAAKKKTLAAQNAASATVATKAAATPAQQQKPTNESTTTRLDFAPPVLSFNYGTFVFEPCIITALSWDIEALLGGEEARIRLNITLTEIPRPKTQAELAEEAQSRLEYLTSQNSTQAKPRTPLTDRQVEQGKKVAEDYLDNNPDVWSPEVIAIIKANAYEFKVDKATGDVTMINQNTKKVMGVVYRWDGTKGIAAKGITTLPLRTPTTKIPELPPVVEIPTLPTVSIDATTLLSGTI